MNTSFPLLPFSGRWRLGSLILIPALILVFSLTGCEEASPGGDSDDDSATPDDLTGTWMVTETMSASAVLPDPDRSVLLEFSGNNYCAMFFENYAQIGGGQCSRGTYTATGGNLTLNQTQEWDYLPENTDMGDWYDLAKMHYQTYTRSGGELTIPHPDGQGGTLSLINASFDVRYEICSQWNSLYQTAAFSFFSDGTWTYVQGTGDSTVNQEGTWDSSTDYLRMEMTECSIGGSGCFEFIRPYMYDAVNQTLTITADWGDGEGVQSREFEKLTIG